MHTSCICLEILSFYLYTQTKIISKCITLMTSKRQKHTYILDTGNMVENLGDNCIQNFHLGRYIVGYTVGNLVLRRRANGAIKRD